MKDYVLKNFTLKEMTKTGTGLPNEIPSFEVAFNLYDTACFLQKLRTLIGMPIVVTSGYRSEAVNKAVGGAKNSAHLRGGAADIRCADNEKLLKVIKEECVYDELGVYYKGGKISRFHVAPYRTDVQAGRMFRKKFYEVFE
jgi:uncharacterized protein YcbK (DUF882 family)